jgi:hypothetical protein
MKTITHLTANSSHKLAKQMTKLDKQVYEALPIKGMKIGKCKEVEVKNTNFKLKIILSENCCSFTISKNDKIITDNLLFTDFDTSKDILPEIISDNKIETKDFPLLVTAIDYENVLIAIFEMGILADLEFCIAQIAYENYFSQAIA